MNNKENKLIPNLRFPEFVDKGEWSVDSLGNLAEIKGRIGYRGYTTDDIVNKGEGAITLSPSNFDENGNLNFDKCTFISWAKYEESPEIKLEEGQTVLVKTASVGKTAYVQSLPEKTTVNPQIVVLKPKVIHNRFLAFTISHEYVQNQIKGSIGAGAIPNMSQDSISKFQILIPPDKEEKTEQQKIADCLSSLDDLITAHTDKLDALKDHKKGLMQNLFPLEGKKVPKLRFKEFEKDGEWENEILKNMSQIIMGSSPSSSTYNENKIGLPLLQGNADIKNRLSSPRIYTEDITKECDVDDILLSVRAPVGTVAKSQHKACIGRGISALRALQPNSQEYLYQWLISFESSWGSISQGGTFDAVNSHDIRNLVMPIPKNPKEQSKIANSLSSLDNLIKEQTKKIEQLKQHKKGLMQGLFPKIK